MSDSDSESDDIEVFPSTEKKGWTWSGVTDSHTEIGVGLKFHDYGQISHMYTYNFIGRPMKKKSKFEENGIYKVIGHASHCGMKEGIVISYSVNDVVNGYGFYKNGAQHGLWCVFNYKCDILLISNAYSFHSKAHYRNGVQHGLYGAYNVDTFLPYYETFYENGVYQSLYNNGRWKDVRHDLYSKILRPSHLCYSLMFV